MSSETPGFSGEAADDWNDVSGPDAIIERLNNGDHCLLAADNDTIVGFIAFRNRTHLSLLFVRESHQGLGIGCRLIEESLLEYMSGVNEITLNSTQRAVGFYRKMGFDVVGQRFEKRGVWCTPMQWTRPK